MCIYTDNRDSILSGALFCRGSLEGKREQKSYKSLLEDPMLRFSGLYQESCSDLYVTCQVFAEGKPLALPVRTSYKAFSTRWKWVHYITAVKSRMCLCASLWRICFFYIYTISSSQIHSVVFHCIIHWAYFKWSQLCPEFTHQWFCSMKAYGCLLLFGICLLILVLYECFLVVMCVLSHCYSCLSFTAVGMSGLSCQWSTPTCLRVPRWL